MKLKQKNYLVAPYYNPKKMIRPSDTLCQFFSHFLLLPYNNNERLIDKFKGDSIHSITEFLKVIFNNQNSIPQNILSFIKEIPGIEFKTNQICFNGASCHYYETLIKHAEPEVIDIIEQQKILAEMEILNNLTSTNTSHSKILKI